MRARRLHYEPAQKAKSRTGSSEIPKHGSAEGAERRRDAENRIPAHRFVLALLCAAQLLAIRVRAGDLQYREGGLQGEVQHGF